MKINLQGTPEQVELIKALASPNKVKAAEAQEAFAGLITPVVQKVLDNAPTAGAIYTDLPYDEDDSPSIPLDSYFGTDVNNVQVWMQSSPGGLASSHVSGSQELKVTTYNLTSAVNMLKKYAKKARLDVVSSAINRLAQEILVRQERLAWSVLMKAVGEASTSVNGTATRHIITSTTQNVFQLDDFNRVNTRTDRLNGSFAAGTPAVPYSKGVTDMFLSPEMMEQVRAFAYQPMNTRAFPNSDESTALGLPDSIREEIFKASGLPSIFDIALHKVYELGVSHKYNALFEAFAPSSIAHSSQNFDATDDEVVIAVDASREAFLRPIAKNSLTGSTVNVVTDDQWAGRSEKMGWFASIEEGRVCVDARAAVAVIV